MSLPSNTLRASALLVAVTLAATRLAAQQRATQSGPELAAWRQDLQTLAVELPHRHRNAFARMTRQQWDSAVAALDTRLPRLRGASLLTMPEVLAAFHLIPTPDRATFVVEQVGRERSVTLQPAGAAAGNAHGGGGLPHGWGGDAQRHARR